MPLAKPTYKPSIEVLKNLFMNGTATSTEVARGLGWSRRKANDVLRALYRSDDVKLFTTIKGEPVSRKSAHGGREKVYQITPAGEATFRSAINGGGTR